MKASEAGFGLVDLIISMAVATALLLIASSTFGMRRPSLHPAVLALQASLAEAHAVAALQQADGTDLGLPTGATVSIDVDPAVAGHSTIAVFRSRPVENPNLSLTGAPPITLVLPPDTGFPRQSVPVLFTINQVGKASYTGRFTILISSAGYTSIVPNYAYGTDRATLTSDPSCSEGGTSIAASTGMQSESHPFDCRTATYDASAPE
jgi:hypothetical protein